MSLPTCDPSGANTIRQSDQLAAFGGNTAGAGEHQIPYLTFLAYVQDALQRLAAKGVTGFQNLSALVPCEASQTNRLTYDQVMEISLPVQANDAEMQQVIIWQLNCALCALGA